MSPLIDKLFSKSQSDAIRILWEDTNSRLLLEKQIGQKLLENRDIINDLPLTQLMLVSALSPFAESSNECYRAAEILYWGIHRTDILPLVTEHQGKDLAYRCLISLGMFKMAMYKRYQYHGAPSPNFYRRVGEESFKRIGMNDIGKHFYQWESFIGEMFA